MTVTPPCSHENQPGVVPIFSFDGFAEKYPRIPSGSGRCLELEAVCSGEWLEWYSLTPQQRWSESQKLWQTYVALGGSLDPEPDTQSPFYDAEASGESAAHGRSGLRVVRRSGV